MHWPIDRSWLLRNSEENLKVVNTQELADYRVACLLGAAGLGKTYEINHLLAVDKSDGYTCTHYDLGKNCSTGEALQQLLNSIPHIADAKYTIFLDSLDEVMIPVTTASNIISNWIEKQLVHKPRLRIACRSAVWPGILHQSLKLVYDENDIHSTELQPFTEDNIRIIADSEGITADDFINELSTKNVIILAKQPLTLKLLIDLYKQCNTLPRSRNELYELSVHKLCRESSDRFERGTSTTLSVDEAIQAAEDLAVLCLLSGNNIVSLEDDVIENSEGILQQETIETLATNNKFTFNRNNLRYLCYTGLFRSEGIRKFTFSHRQIAEYLAGMRISKLPMHQARALLAKDGGHEYGIAGPLRETSAFAASSNDKLAEWLTKYDPEVIGISDIPHSRLRKKALDGFIGLFRKGKYTDAQLHKDIISLDGFKYSNMEDDLRPLLKERGSNLEDVHAIVIELIEQGKLSKLSDELADMFLDSSVNLGTRKWAGYALSKVGKDSAKYRTKKYIQGSDDDNENEDLKGLALRCNWPNNITEVELLNALSKPKRNNYHGAYQGFLWDLDQSKFHAANSLDHGLKWARKIQSRNKWHEALNRIAGRIAFSALDHISDKNICNLLVNLILDAAENHFQPFYTEKNDDNYCSDPDNLQISNKFSTDQLLRHKLIEEIAKHKLNSKKRPLFLPFIPGLCHIDDFEWLLNHATNSKYGNPDCYMRFANQLNWHSEQQCISIWLQKRNESVIKEYFNIPLSIVLDSDIANEQRKSHELNNRHEKQHSPITPTPIVQTLDILDCCNNDPRCFWKLAMTLTLEEDGTYNPSERFIINTIGWENADKDLKLHIVKAAKRLLLECYDIANKSKKISLNSILCDGGMSAIFLLLKIDKDWLNTRSAEWWKHWTWYIIREFHYNLMEEDNKPKLELLELLHFKASSAFHKTLIALAKSPKSTNLYLSTLGMMNVIQCPKLDKLLCQYIKQKKLRGKLLFESMKFVLKRDPENAINACIQRISNKTRNGANVPAVLACVALLIEQPAKSWRKVFDFIKLRSDLAIHILEQVADTEILLNNNTIKTINHKQFAELLNSLFLHFPPDKDPKYDGVHSVSPRDNAIHLRDRILNYLTDSNSNDAVDSLRILENIYGTKYPWLRRSRSIAEHNLNQTKWTPLPVIQIADILYNSENRLLKSADDVIDFTVAILQDYENKLHHGPAPQIEELWNTNLHPEPKAEEWISNKFKHELDRSFKEYSITVGREVQIRRSILPSTQGGMPGQNTDLLIEVPSSGISRGEPIIVIVEVKRSCNSNVKSDMQDQLVDRYLYCNNFSYGIYIVAYFNAPKLKPSLKPKWTTIQEAKQYLHEQADKINNGTSNSIRVESFVLDARLQ